MRRRKNNRSSIWLQNGGQQLTAGYKRNLLVSSARGDDAHEPIMHMNTDPGLIFIHIFLLVSFLHPFVGAFCLIVFKLTRSKIPYVYIFKKNVSYTTKRQRRGELAKNKRVHDWQTRTSSSSQTMMMMMTRDGSGLRARK
jgi:hypothetical protein